jgi:catechol 2,3-dioxygenase-like lactoylglutathione lyase family enzyme
MILLIDGVVGSIIHKEAAVSDQQIQKVKVKRLAHVGLWTTDVVAQARFYRQVMGFDLRKVSDGSADQDVSLEDANMFLALGDEHHCLGLFNDIRPITTNGRRPVQRTPLHHLAFEVDTDAELAALAARLQLLDVELRLEPRDGDPEMGDTLWFSDPDGNQIEILVPSDDFSSPSFAPVRNGRRGVRPLSLQHIALQTAHLEAMVDFYTEALGFDISDWLLRECVWLRCNSDHRTIIFTQGDKQGIDHIGYAISDSAELLHWGDYLSRHQTPVLWGPGRHGAGNDLFLRFADPDGIHVELSTELQQYYDHDVTTPPRLWHTRSVALNLWGTLPAWIREEVRV